MFCSIGYKRWSGVSVSFRNVAEKKIIKTHKRLLCCMVFKQIVSSDKAKQARRRLNCAFTQCPNTAATKSCPTRDYSRISNRMLWERESCVFSRSIIVPGFTKLLNVILSVRPLKKLFCQAWRQKPIRKQENQITVMQTIIFQFR